ncbi:MAG: hypothetical protein JST86_01560 [Bacteroidetes bacterium]|nr:hypothetical protein [Bacteroidota bacterium]
MKTDSKNPHLKVVVEQVANNTTAWMGHRKDNEDILAGQTFVCPAEGDLGAIEIFSSLVIKPGHAKMTVHPFDPSTKKWGPALLHSSVNIEKTDSDKWISFPQNGLHMQKGSSYGFRLQSDDMYIGIGEAASSHQQPLFTGGQEWIGAAADQPGKYFNYLTLAFKVEVRA